MSEHNSPQPSATSDHVSSLASSLGVWLTLLVFTGITVGVAFINLGPFNAVVALSIATFKAIMVVLFFMHVKYTHEKMTPLVIVSAIFFLLILLALSMADYATRFWS